MKTESTKYNLGIALSGGGARGFAHAGALKAIEDAGYKAEILSGTSAGAIAAIFYADGYTPEEIVELFVGKPLKEFAQIQVPTVSMLDMAGFRKFLKKNLRHTNFEDLNIPVKIVASNLDEGKSKVFDKGPINEALIASCSIPIVFSPVKIDGINYVDGGLLMNFPVSIIRNECKKVIGVNASPMVSKKYNHTITQIAERSYHYMSRTNTLLDRELCDLLVEIKDLINYKTFDLKSANEIFKIGYDYGKKVLNEKDE